MDQTPGRKAVLTTHPAFALTLDGPTRVAVVGAGFIAEYHLEILRSTPDVKVIAVCDSNEARAAGAAGRYSVEHAVTDIEELPALGVQVAHLTVPPDLHVPLTRRLLELGIGVFAEKPFALTTDESRDLVQLAREQRLPVAVNHNSVFHPAFVRMVERVHAGEIGTIQHVQITFSIGLRALDAGDFTHWMFQAPRNIVFESATHPLSRLHHLLGKVKSSTTKMLGSRELYPGQVFHDRWLFWAEAERGTAEIYMAAGASFVRDTMQVLGTDGFLEADLFHNLLSGERKTQWLDAWESFCAGHRRGGELRRDARRSFFDWAGSTLKLRARRDPFFVGMRDSVRSFHRSLRAGEAPPSDGTVATEVIEWCDAMAGDASGASMPSPEFSEPGAARPGEVVVTGANGFIGRHFVRQLLAQNVPVTAIVRRVRNLPPEIVEPALDGRLRLVRASLDDEPNLMRALEGARACVHLATGGGSTWDEVEQAMVRGSVRLAELCRDADVSRFVYVSSISALYAGADCGAPVIDDSLETDPRIGERAIYARGKAAAEAALLELHREQSIGLVIVRPGVVLGEGAPMQHSGVGLWVRDNHCVGWGRGDHPLPFVLVDDVANAFVRVVLFEGNELDGKAINLCARVPLTAREYVAELARCTGRPIVFHPRALPLSQTMEIGKWLIKRIGRRKDASFPAYRDLKSRALTPPFTCRTARDLLHWTPVEDREQFLDRAARIYGRDQR